MLFSVVLLIRTNPNLNTSPDITRTRPFERQVPTDPIMFSSGFANPTCYNRLTFRWRSGESVLCLEPRHLEKKVVTATCLFLNTLGPASRQVEWGLFFPPYASQFAIGRKVGRFAGFE